MIWIILIVVIILCLILSKSTKSPMMTMTRCPMHRRCAHCGNGNCPYCKNNFYRRNCPYHINCPYCMNCPYCNKCQKY